MKPEEEARRALLSRKAVLDRIVAETVEEEGYRSDSRELVDLASEHAARQLAATLGEAEHREIKEIEAALQRIEEGCWGQCQNCHRAIGRQRLHALPETRNCAACSSEMERSKLSFG